MILGPLNEDSQILTILSISSKINDTESIIFHTELPSFLICSNHPGRMPGMVKYLEKKSSSLEPIDQRSRYFICSIEYSSISRIFELFSWFDLDQQGQVLENAN